MSKITPRQRYVSNNFLNQLTQFYILNFFSYVSFMDFGKFKVEEKFENVSLISSTNKREKFLDGLLDTRFDEPSCMSRYQSHIYRKASPHKPSSYLIWKLRNYEEIHTRCGPNSKAYFRSMTKILRSKSIKAGDAPMCKYLIWKPVNGLGNQMVSMVATFLYK